MHEISSMLWAFDHVPAVVAVVDDQGTVLYVNPAYTKITGFGSEEIIGKAIDTVFPNEMRGDEKERTFGALRAGMQADGEIQVASKDGSAIWLRYIASPVRSETGEIVHFVAVAMEITKEKELERQFLQAQKMEAIGELAGGLAHDFNNMLTVIGGYADILMAELAGDEVLLSYAESVRSAAAKAGTLTHQLLAYSRKQILSPTVLNPNTVITELYRLISGTLRPGIEMRLRLSSEIGRIRIDRSQLEQVLMNLAVNAVDAIAGKGTVAISTENVELSETHVDFRPEIQPGAYVMMSVSDSGSGMDQETAARVFEPFFTTKKKGTGLGLATVYGIVKQSGGYIYLHTHPGKGTTFKLFFPITPIELETTIAPARTRPRESLGGTERILLVEDDEQVCEIMRRALTGAGYKIEVGASAEDAMKSWRTRRKSVDLLIADIVLPGKDGLELCRRLRRSRPRLKALFITGYARALKIRDGDIASEDLLLEKPFGIRDLLVRVREALDRR